MIVKANYFAGHNFCDFTQSNANFDTLEFNDSKIESN